MKHVLTTLLLTAAFTMPAVLANAQTNSQTNQQATGSTMNMGTEAGVTSGMASDSTGVVTTSGVNGAAGITATQQQLQPNVLSQSNIRDIQQSLNSEGYYQGSVDGVWGAGTVAALRQFQLDNGLQSDGQISGRTLDTLGVQLSAADSARIQASGGILANEPVGATGTLSGTAGTTSSGATEGPTSTPGASTMSTPGSSTMSTPGASTLGDSSGSTSSGSAASGSSSAN